MKLLLLLIVLSVSACSRPANNEIKGEYKFVDEDYMVIAEGNDWFSLDYETERINKKRWIKLVAKENEDVEVIFLEIMDGANPILLSFRYDILSWNAERIVTKPMGEAKLQYFIDRLSKKVTRQKIKSRGDKSTYILVDGSYKESRN